MLKFISGRFIYWFKEKRDMLQKIFWVIVCLMGTFVNMAFALQPGFNVQGRLTDAEGNPTEGPVTLRFSVYQNLTDDPPVAPIWVKTLPDTPLDDGNFQVLLEGAGDDTYATIENAVRDLPGAFVEVKVDAEAPMAPRLPIVKSAFSSTDRVFGQNDVLMHSETGNLTLKTGNSEKIVVLNNGNVGINTTTPDQKLTVNGSIKIIDGTQGYGKVLTSDADGKAAWQTPEPGGASAAGMTLVYSYTFNGTETSLSVPVGNVTSGIYNMKVMAKAQNLTTCEESYIADQSITIFPNAVPVPDSGESYPNIYLNGRDFESGAAVYHFFNMYFGVFDGRFMGEFSSYRDSSTGNFNQALSNSILGSLELVLTNYECDNSPAPSMSNIIAAGSVLKLYKYN